MLCVWPFRAAALPAATAALALAHFLSQPGSIQWVGKLLAESFSLCVKPSSPPLLFPY